MHVERRRFRYLTTPARVHVHERTSRDHTPALGTDRMEVGAHATEVALELIPVLAHEGRAPGPHQDAVLVGHVRHHRQGRQLRRRVAHAADVYLGGDGPVRLCNVRRQVARVHKGPGLHYGRAGGQQRRRKRTLPVREQGRRDSPSAWQHAFLATSPRGGGGERGGHTPHQLRSMTGARLWTSRAS